VVARPPTPDELPRRLAGVRAHNRWLVEFCSRRPERRAGIALSSADVYVSTVGGIRIHEPGADLAIALAVASAAKDVPLASTTAAIGEISLAGEIRQVTQATQRASEAVRLGFTVLLDQSHTTISEAITRAFAESPAKKTKPAF
jgi:DNA repair protein RadA/Sms